MSCMALVKRPVSAHFDPSSIKMERRKALALPPPVNKEGRSHATNSLRLSKRKPPADSSCGKTESPPAQKKHWTELSATCQKSAGASSVNGKNNWSPHRSPKCKAGTSCFHATLILTDVLKTRLGQEYLNRGSLGLRAEQQERDAVSCKSSRRPQRQEGNLQGEAPSFARSRDSPVRGSRRDSPTPRRDGHQVVPDASCPVEETPHGTCSPKLRSRSVALRGLSVEMCKISVRPLDRQRCHNSEDKAATALEMGKGGILPGGAGRVQCHPGCEGSPSQATEAADGEGSPGSCTNGIGVIEVGSPCTPQETRTSVIMDRRDPAKRICLMDVPVAAEERCHFRDPPEPQHVERSPSGSDPSLDPPRKPKSSPPEPIVLSSDDEEGKDGKEEVRLAPDGIPGPSVLRSDPQPPDSPSALEHQDEHGETQPNMLFSGGCCGRKDMSQVSTLLQLPFCELHVGGVTVQAGGDIMITDQGITIPLKASSGEAECLSVALVPTQLCKYGLWNSGVQGNAGALLFLWVSDAELELLKAELSALQPAETLGTASPFLLLTLRQPLDGIHKALLGSLMDLMSLQNKQPELMQPLSLDEGLALISSSSGGDCSLLPVLRGEPQDQTRAASSQVETGPQPTAPPEENPGRPRPSYTLCHRRTSRSYAVSMSPKPDSPWSRYQHQGQANRLILFPPPPWKGGISVTMEGCSALDSGEFLNDVIIDFYLKYLVLDKAQKEMVQRCHVFSSFFYSSWTRKDNASEESGPHLMTLDHYFTESGRPHQRRVRGGMEETRGMSLLTPKCTQLGCQRDTICKRPCILLMDSLNWHSHERVLKFLREYLEVEWEARRGTPRAFTPETMLGFRCRVPLQDNSSDCGLYLLQYAESFLENPVVHFEPPFLLGTWFPRQKVRRKREEIRNVVLWLFRKQREQREQWEQWEQREQREQRRRLGQVKARSCRWEGLPAAD
ncbi:LOW QUALITY PROTEIN: sentrin-specific protease 7-like [Brienomyrus brachyistius]|uniref:LOW QUALITY PROTEIN: sentrin-specific protease 7-like n=1 Tax=Brienomyrus brachyistius TaxID=42636 RepID=UPI0020B24902|nr:LOW QUALITY PROTEIN: sentrin-specific protease 7-like [Brienomyrus brachyistius]